jgi:hypothetical protein
MRGVASLLCVARALGVQPVVFADREVGVEIEQFAAHPLVKRISA